jgi:hypothetical protein
MFKIAKYILSGGLVIGATAASAGDLVPDAANGIMNSCRQDYHRMCSYVAPGDGRVARCLMEHQSELSPYCLNAIRVASSVEACYGDYERFCRDVPRGPQAFRCLAGKMDLLIPACRRVVAANAPYMLPPGGERYGYNGGPAPYSRPYGEPAPYGGQVSPAPYSGSTPYGAPAPYGYQSGPGYQDRYAGPSGPESRPYNGYGYGTPGDSDRYAEGAPQSRPYEGYEDQPAPSYGDRYAEGSPERYRPYGYGYGGGGYPGGNYNNVPPYGPQGDR